MEKESKRWNEEGFYGTAAEARQARDARWRELTKTQRHVVRATDQEQDQVRLSNGRMPKGEMVYVVRWPR